MATESGIFSITAPAGTDIWRKPPSHNVFTAPYTTPPNTTTKGPLQAFRSAQVSFSLPLIPAPAPAPAPASAGEGEGERGEGRAKGGAQEYDQAGLLITFPGTNRWIKAGLEIYHGQPMLSTVATDTASDWSIVQRWAEEEENEEEKKVVWTSVSVEAGRDELGQSLLVFAESAAADAADGEKKRRRIQLREICWAYAYPAAEMPEIAVAAFAARPEKVTTLEPLTAEFRGFEVVFSG